MVCLCSLSLILRQKGSDAYDGAIAAGVIICLLVTPNTQFGRGDLFAFSVKARGWR